MKDSDLLKELPLGIKISEFAIPDNVNSPAHYNSHPSGIECITITEHMTFNLGNAIKYLWRAGLKAKSSDIEDLQKSIWYINREIQRISKT